MKAFVGVLLLFLVACSAEEVKSKDDTQIRRGLEHSNNIALLNNLSIDKNRTPADGLNQNAVPDENLINVGNLNTPSGGNIQVTYNTENIGLPVGNPQPFPPDLAFGYAPAYGPAYANPAPAPNLPLPFGNLALQLPAPQINPGIVNSISESRNLVQGFIPQGPVPVPQQYPLHLIKEVQVPQPYPVHITRTVQVPVQVRVPVEVPKPYEVRVPHPVPVPVHIRIPVAVAKPYAVQVTKTVAIPVEKPIYIRVPQPIQVPVPQPYPVGVPQPVHIRVPFPIFLGGPERPLPAELSNLGGPVYGGGFNTALSGGANAAGISGVPHLSPAPLLITPPSPTASITPTSTTGPCELCHKEPPKTQVVVTPSLATVTGNGLLPPLPPANPNANLNLLSGLLNSYVASKEGGVYRREANQYQTAEYQKTW